MNALITPLPVLIAALREAKRIEADATAKRLEIESQIIAHYPQKTEGSITDKDNGLTLTFGVTRKVDTEKLKAEWNLLSESVQKSFAWDARVIVKNLRAIQDLQPETYAQLCNFITTTPKKTTVTLKDMKD